MRPNWKNVNLKLKRLLTFNLPTLHKKYHLLRLHDSDLSKCFLFVKFLKQSTQQTLKKIVECVHFEAFRLTLIKGDCQNEVKSSQTL